MDTGGISIDRVTVTALPTAIGAATERQLVERFKRYVADAHLQHVVALDDEDFEPQSLSLVLRLSCIVRDAGGAMCLVTSLPRARSVLSATRIDRLLPIFPNVDAAIAHLSPDARRLSA
jgi:hypothetical protein